MKFKYLKKAKLNTLPKAPGVYAFFSPTAIVYIGKGGNLRNRVKNHFAQPTWRDSLFIKKVSKVGYIKTYSEIDALILESQLIKKQQPRYNVMWKDDKKYFFVAITKEKLPRVFLTHQPILPRQSQVKTKSPLANAQYIGPFVEGKTIKRVLRLLRRAFPYYTAKKHGPDACAWCHLSLCPGPAPEAKAYKRNIKNLVSVLQGKRIFVLKQLQKDMKAAAKSQDFENAALLRDQFLSLKRIVSHARLFSPEVSSEPSWDMIEKELQKLFSTKKKITRVEAYDISNIQGKQATGSQVTFLKGTPVKESYRKYKIKIAGKPNDFAMMQELVARRLSHPEWPFPQLMVIDGGKGQLSSAAAALKEHTKEDIFLSALAKKKNELFFLKKKHPVLLENLPRPAENLFLHIRDEAHRFAVKYHRTLRSKALFN